MFSEYMIICIFYILGIVISKTLDMSGAVFLAVLLFFVATVKALKKNPQALGIFLLSAVVLFGSARYFNETQNRIYYEFPEKYVNVSGVIYSQTSSSENEDLNRYILKLDTISYLDKTAKTNQKIILNTEYEFPFGTKIVASGFLYEIGGINNEHEFDFATYYKGKDIFARLMAKEIKDTGMAFSLSPEFLLGKARYQASLLINKHFHGNSAAFLKAIILGDKSGFSDKYLDLLIKTGIYRVLYTPFIHISLIFFLAAFLPFDKKQRSYLIVLLIFLYGLANSSSPTIIKAALLCGLFLLRKQIFGFANKMDLISKIVLVMTILDPLLCFNSGFFMSVASTVVLYISYKPLFMWFLRFFTKYKLKHRMFLSKTLAIWLTFLFGTLPLCAYLFDGVSVYAVLFTTIIAPVIMLVLVLFPIMLLFSELLGTSFGLVPLVDKIMKFIAFLPELAQKLPAYYIELKTPKISEIIGFYLFWWVFLRLISNLKTRKTAIILCVAIGFSLSALPFHEFNTLSIYFVNVGQGDGAVLHTSRGETVLIDGGGAASYETSYNVGERVYVPYLTSHGFSNIDVAIVTHFHKDHAEGIVAAAENLKINTLVMPDTDPENPYRIRLCEIAENKGIKVEYLAATDEITFDSGLNIRFIAPDSDQLQSNDANDTSLVAHVTYGDFSALFTGDSTDEINENYPRDVDLLKVPHHGSDNHTPEDYLEHTNPDYAVISVGKNNSYNLPSKNVILRIKESGAKILRTDKMGDIQFKVKKYGSFTYKTLKGE